MLEHLRSEAVRRGLRTGDTGPLDAAAIFSLVRDMPYGRPSDHDPRTLIREWRGTCSGKHALLHLVYREMGYRTTLMACTQEIRAEGGPIPDVHNYLILHSDHGDMIVDATWPLSYRTRGLPVNEEFVWGQDMQLACVPLETFAVPEGVEVHAHKDELLRARYSAEELARREAFIEGLGRLSGTE